MASYLNHLTLYVIPLDLGLSFSSSLELNYFTDVRRNGEAESRSQHLFYFI